MFFVFYFIKISKFALPGVMLIYERTSKDRKKDRKNELEVGCLDGTYYMSYLLNLIGI